MLKQRQVAAYLLRRNLITPRSIIEEDLSIYDLSRRNHNFAAVRADERSYLLKQAIDPARILSLRNEAAIYGLFYTSTYRDKKTALRYLPGFVDYDKEEHILVVEFLPDALDLQEHHTRYGRFSTKLGSSLGRALSFFHRMDVGPLKQGTLSGHNQPWIFSLHRPSLEAICDISQPNIRIIEMIQRNSQFCDLLDELREGWRMDSFIHSDIKWENCLFFASGKKAGLKIIDWELAGLGDPMWDVGSVFSAYLSFWLLYVPVTSGSSPDDFIQSARYPLGKMHPAIRAFWSSYTQRMKLDSQTASFLLLRAVRYAAARLAQMSVEQMHLASKLSVNAAYFLQLGLNILERPEKAAAVLLGISANSDGHS